MVIEANAEEINFYPLDMIENDPPEIIIKDDYNTNFRVGQIMRYNDFLINEITKREGIIKSFKRFEWVCFVVEILFVLTNVSLGAIGLAYQDYISTTSSICIFITTFTTFVRSFCKKIMTKLERHQALVVLAKNKFSIAKDKYDIAIRDGDISHEEYMSIVDEFKKYENSRLNIINSIK